MRKLIIVLMLITSISSQAEMIPEVCINCNYFINIEINKVFDGKVKGSLHPESGKKFTFIDKVSYISNDLVQSGEIVKIKRSQFENFDDAIETHFDVVNKNFPQDSYEMYRIFGFDSNLEATKYLELLKNGSHLLVFDTKTDKRLTKWVMSHEIAVINLETMEVSSLKAQILP